MEKSTVLFFGTPSFVLPVLQTLVNRFTVVGVVTTPDQKVGRKQILTPSAVKVFAEEYKLPVFQPGKLTSISEQLATLAPDLIVVASYGKIIPQIILDIPKLGALNIHPSALPKYRGPSPVQSALLAGETETEVDVIEMDAELDHGPILARKKLIIESRDTFVSLVDRAFKTGAEILPRVIEELQQGTLEKIQQDHSFATYTKHFTRQDGYFDSKNPPSKEHIDRMIRAFYPWPNAWTKIDGKVVKFFPEEKVQMEGKNVVSKKEFLNGYPRYKEMIQKLV